MGSDKISADVVEIQEFLDLARKYQVRSVPMTILNDDEALVGTIPPMQMIDAVERAGRAE